jgi:hypothetical protein
MSRARSRRPRRVSLAQSRANDGCAFALQDIAESRGRGAPNCPAIDGDRRQRITTQRRWTTDVEDANGPLIGGASGNRPSLIYRFQISNSSASESWTGQGFRTNDYVRLKTPLYLAEYEISLPRYDAVNPMRPFVDWSVDAPTQNISWYDNYNKSKHDGLSNLSSATLLSCIEAVAAIRGQFRDASAGASRGEG